MTPEPGFPVRMIGDVPVVRPPRRSTSPTPTACGRPWPRPPKHGRGRFVVDLTRTQFCDTAGLHALVAAHKRARTESGRMVLVMPGAGVLRIFEITGLDNVIPHVTSLAEALAQTR